MSAGTTVVPLRARPAAPEAREGQRLASSVLRRIGASQLIAGGWGAIDVFLLLWLVLPDPAHSAPDGEVLLANAITLGIYLPLAALAGAFACLRITKPSLQWLADGRAPTEAEQRSTLCIPMQLSAIDASGWALGAVVFFFVNLPYGSDLAWHVSSTIVMGGLTCTALGYLLAERLARPLAARALAFGPVRPKGPGVAGRLILVWLFASGMPLVGIIMVGCSALTRDGVTTRQLATSTVVLGGVAIFVGLFGMKLAAKSLAEPLRELRKAIRRIESGDLGAEVRVNDGSEVGLLQSGFNAMAAGLRERERMRDLFGRHVGEDVARSALERDTPALGGELRDVAVLFVDLIGSTSMAAHRPPREVVQLLNDFFAVVVDVAERHGGWVNKFEGDAAMVVFGAPGDHDDCAGGALSAARVLRDRLRSLPGIDAGIGISAGPAVAGNVGAERRFEFTVIGDPVNEAARLCELAKRRPERVLASESILRRCGAGAEAGRWRDGEEVVLRGRSTPTRLAVPAA